MACTLWKRTSEGFGPPTPLPGAARSGDRRDVSGGFAEIQLSASALRKLRCFAAEYGLALPSIAAGAWAIILSRHSGEEDVVFGILQTRTGDPPEILPFRVPIHADCLLLPWLAAINETLTDRTAATSSTMPAGSSDPDGDPSFESVIQFDPPSDSTKLHLPLHISVSPECRVAATYDGARFCEGAIVRILGQIKTILESIPSCAGTNISAVRLMPESELRDLVTGRNGTETDYRDAMCIHQWFEEQVARTPDATAVVFHDQTLRYRELDEKANRLAARLRELGAAPDQVVALCVERSLEMVVGLFGILKSGAAYLPLDPAFPPERVQFMLEDSGAAIVVTQEHLIARVPASGAHTVSIQSLLHGAGRPHQIHDLGEVLLILVERWLFPLRLPLCVCPRPFEHGIDPRSTQSTLAAIILQCIVAAKEPGQEVNDLLITPAIQGHEASQRLHVAGEGLVLEIRPVFVVGRLKPGRCDP